MGARVPLPPAEARPHAPPGCRGGRVRAGGAGVAGKRARAQGAGAVRLVYLDECEVHRHPRLTRVWRRRGTTLRVPAAGEDARFTAYGALDYTSGRLIWQTAAHKNSATFVAFLDRLAAAFPTDQVLAVLDNVGYHKSHAARRWWVAHGAPRPQPPALAARLRPAAAPHRARLAAPQGQAEQPPLVGRPPRAGARHRRPPRRPPGRVPPPRPGPPPGPQHLQIRLAPRAPPFPTPGPGVRGAGVRRRRSGARRR
jgi:hypothetical protein